MSAKKGKRKSTSVESKAEAGLEVSLDASRAYETVFVDLEPYHALSGAHLTGIRRQQKDKVADLANAVSRWEAACAQGSQFLTKIANIKLEAVYAADKSSEVVIPESLEKEVQDLASQVSQMEEVVEKLEQLSREFEALRHLDPASQESTPLTLEVEQTLPDILNRFLRQFEKELQVKRLICEHVAHVRHRHQMTFYVSAWNHQPYLDDQDLKYQLALVMKATGHG